MLEIRVGLVLLLGVLVMAIYVDVALRPLPKVQSGAVRGVQERRASQEAARRSHRLPGAIFGAFLALTSYYAWRSGRPRQADLDAVNDYDLMREAASADYDWAQGMLLVPLAGLAVCIVSMDVTRRHCGPLAVRRDVLIATRAELAACAYYAVLLVHMVNAVFMGGMRLT
ncbi:MAG: heme A synthase [Planctomycetota bacterium]|jgi:heme A synthase